MSWMYLQVETAIVSSIKHISSTFTFVPRVCQKNLVALGPVLNMGRSVPPWRTRVEDELSRLHAYRRALSTVDQAAFDALTNELRQRRAAGGMLPSLDAWQPMMLSMLVGLMANLTALERRLKTLEEDLRER